MTAVDLAKETRRAISDLRSAIYDAETVLDDLAAGLKEAEEPWKGAKDEDGFPLYAGFDPAKAYREAMAA